MILACGFGDMRDVVEESWAARMHARGKIGHEINADDTALVGDGLDRGIRYVARMVGNRTSTRMADCERSSGEGRGFLDRPGTAMSQIEEQLLGLDPADRVTTKIGEAGVARFDRSISAQIC